MSRRPAPYKPQTNSLPGRVVAFFAQNRDEELTLEDIAAKFDCSRNTIHTNLQLATDNHLLERFRNAHGEYLYRAGQAAHTPTAAARTPAAPSKRRDPTAWATLAAVDPAQVPIEDGVPIATRFVAPDWAVLLQRLQPGQSAQLPLAARHTLAREISKAHATGKGRFSLRASKDTQTLRVWRTA